MTINKNSESFPTKHIEHLVKSLGSNHISVEIKGEELENEFYVIELTLNGKIVSSPELDQLGSLYGFKIAVPADKVTEVAILGNEEAVEQLVSTGEITFETFTEDAQGVTSHETFFKEAKDAGVTFEEVARRASKKHR